MDSLIACVAEELSASAVVLDYKYHRAASFPAKAHTLASKHPLTYADLLADVETFVGCLASRHAKLFLVGHSLGARLLTDSLLLQTLAAKSVLLNLPFQFKASAWFESRRLEIISKSSETSKAEAQEDFLDYFYSIHELFMGQREKLPRNHELFLDCGFDYAHFSFAGAPDSPGSCHDNTKVLLGECDARLCEDNAKNLRRVFNENRVSTIPSVGHFPMIEAPEVTCSFVVNSILN